MVYQLETTLCRGCQQPFRTGQAVVAEVLADDHGQPTTYDLVHARCIQEVDNAYRGPQGNTGPPGPQGPVGRTGRATTGEQGTPGRKGTQGPIGPQGEPGPRGPAGHQGKRGIPGEQGDSGPPGHGGPTGRAGTPGQPGQDYAEEVQALQAQMAHLTRIVGATPLTGTVVCPQCANTWDVQDNLHLGELARAVVTCNCGADLVITRRGAQLRHGK
mgnify:CR=1 FL=1